MLFCIVYGSSQGSDIYNNSSAAIYLYYVPLAIIFGMSFFPNAAVY